MKKLTTFSFLLVLAFSSCSVFKQSANGELIGVAPRTAYEIDVEKHLPKKAKAYFEGMQFIYSWAFTPESAPMVLFSDRDSNVIVADGPQQKRYTLPGFYMSEHELTASEYKSFIEYVKLRLITETLKDIHPEYFDESGQMKKDVEIDWNEQEFLDRLYLPSEEGQDQLEFNTGLLTFKHLIFLNNMPVIVETNIFPDTKVWEKDYHQSYSYEDVPDGSYFSDPYAGDYPITGVSYRQAMAYCEWRTDRLNEEILLKEKILEYRGYEFSTREFLEEHQGYDYESLLPGYFSLPTEIEWELAAGSNESNSFQEVTYLLQKSYPLIDQSSSKYIGNFGPVYDQHGLLLKDFGNDGYEYIAPVKSYVPNDFGMYDMAGNVAEWVSDDFYTAYAHEFSRALFSQPGFETGIQDEIRQSNWQGPRLPDSLIIAESDDTLTIERKLYQIREALAPPILENYMFNSVSDDIFLNARNLKKHFPARFVKGGSWNDAPVYLLPSTKTIFNENAGSSKIGFRVAFYPVG